MSTDPLRRLDALEGDRLAQLAMTWGARPEVPPAIGITDRDIDVLAVLHDVGYLSTSALQILFWGRAIDACHRRLKLLHDAGLVDHVRPRVPRARGSHEWIYRLATPGWQLLRRARRAADFEEYNPATLTSIAYVEHDVHVAALVVRLAARIAGTHAPLTPLLASTGFDWLGPRRGAIDPRSELALDARHPASLIGERVIESGRSTPGFLKPDATLLGPDAVSEQQFALMIEYDRTRRPAKQLKRLRHYDHFLLEGWRRSRYASSPEEPAVLLVCDDERQLDGFVLAADSELTAHLVARGEKAARAQYPGREQIAFTTTARLAAGDWRMLQVPALPPALRPPGLTARAPAPREITVALDRVFAPPASSRRAA